MNWLTEAFEPQFMQRALLAGILASAATSVAGTWVVVRGLAFLGEKASAADVRALNEELGWYDPVPVQWARYVGNALRGDLGRSFRTDRRVAQDLREHMARLGFRTVDEMVGRVDKIAPARDVKHFKASQLDLSRLLRFMRANDRCGTFCCVPQDHGLDRALDNELVRLAAPALEKGEAVQGSFEIRNIHRTVGTILGQEITRRTGEEGLPEDTIRFKATGSAGQSFMAFAPRGLTIELEGEANDYFCKGLSGGTAILYPPRRATFDPNENVICGNVSFYGATSGQAFILGPAGERFCVRNSGAHVVVEGVGDHGCEYMTGGRTVVLGEVGRNFAAGMSGGIAYIWDADGRARLRINRGMVELEDVVELDEIADLRAMIERHAELTGSKRARRILATWDVQLGKFIKVMPRDYKRALAELAAEAAAVA